MTISIYVLIMEKSIKLVFHNQGLRSYIELDLCSACPRQDCKGCCGFYSPVFYPTDLAFIYMHRPELLDFIFTQQYVTVLDTSITINSRLDPDSSGYLCSFHTKESGCILPQFLREPICRIFVCPGVNWQQEPELKNWRVFFEKLFNYEMNINEQLSAALLSKGLSLRQHNRRDDFFAHLLPLYQEAIREKPAFFAGVPEQKTIIIKRMLSYKSDWII